LVTSGHIDGELGHRRYHRREVEVRILGEEQMRMGRSGGREDGQEERWIWWCVMQLFVKDGGREIRGKRGRACSEGDVECFGQKTMLGFM
jgi:hypothetical protein